MLAKSGGLGRAGPAGMVTGRAETPPIPPFCTAWQGYGSPKERTLRFQMPIQTYGLSITFPR